MILEPPKIKSDTVSIVSQSMSHFEIKLHVIINVELIFFGGGKQTANTYYIFTIHTLEAIKVIEVLHVRI